MKQILNIRRVYAYLIDEYKARTDEKIIDAISNLLPEKEILEQPKVGHL